MKTSYKITGALLIVAAAIAHLLNSGYADWNAGGNSGYVGALAVLFFLKERIEDERVKTLKLYATTLGFVIGYCVTIGLKVLTGSKMVTGLPRTLSAFDFMFVMMVAASALFHWWRWQDGREERAK